MSGLGKRQSPKAPFKRCYYCGIRYSENRTPCLMCLRDHEIDLELRSKKVDTYTPITEQWVSMEDALQARKCEFFPVDLTLEEVGDMAAIAYAKLRRAT